ncbi:hypothetical protein NDU88_002732 [Pleurodeles waltl]|uniref:Uncharacterized protein n=1 Tax=Pleurodeles waltl TaxID=8319 RepID=A0AAV7WM08_PLEWA|nr:hypothetical protein NDU88_002732 [Pleurodeles waltl]
MSVRETNRGEMFVVECMHHLLTPRPVLEASPRPVKARLLNYRDHDAALRKGRDLKTLLHEGSEISLYSDLTQ